MPHGTPTFSPWISYKTNKVRGVGESCIFSKTIQTVQGLLILAIISHKSKMGKEIVRKANNKRSQKMTAKYTFSEYGLTLK